MSSFGRDRQWLGGQNREHEERLDNSELTAFETISDIEVALERIREEADDLGSKLRSMVSLEVETTSQPSGLSRSLLKAMVGGPSDGLAARLSESNAVTSQAFETVVIDLIDQVSSLAMLTTSLRDRVDRLAVVLEQVKAAQEGAAFRPWFSSVDFDEVFRGPREAIAARYEDIADLLASTGGPVADLGCGRGELLELLRRRGTSCWGAEINPDLVDYDRRLGLEVRQQDAFSALSELPDRQLGGVALIQVVEHLTASQLVSLVPLIRQKLRPNGVAVAETVNAQSPYVFTRSFYLDPTHTNPIPADYLRFIFERAGFSSVRVEWRSPVPEEDQLPDLHPDEEASPLIDQLNTILAKLNSFLFSPQDYAIVAIA